MGSGSYRILAALASTTVLATGAIAQETAAPMASGEAEEILVTARRTAERLQDVPISVSAITAEQIERTGAQGLEDIARQTPGFSFERTTGTLAQPVIRGQAQQRLTNPVQNVATFFNGVYLQRPYQVDSELLGLERVEVIKGPQSALFGRNAFAGAISYVTTRPDLESLALGASATIGTQDRRELKGSVSAPLVRDTFAVSFAASTSEFDGTWRNGNLTAATTGPAVRTKGRLNGYDNEGFLAQARLKLAGIVEVNAFWNRRDIFVESPANYQMAPIGLISGFNVLNCSPFQAAAQLRLGTNGQFCGALPATPVLATGEPRAAGLVADTRTFGQDSRTNVAGASVDVSATEVLTLSYQFGYTDADAQGVGTLSRDPVRGVAAPGPFFGRVLFDSRGNGELESRSHELRANYETDALRILIGGYASKVSDFDFGASYAAVPNSGAALTNVLFPGGDLFPPGFSATQRRERVRAVFGLVGADLGENLRVTLEGRETRERIKQQAATFPARNPVGTLFNREFKYFTPRATLDYKAGDDMLLYVSAARGVKSGGFNPAAILAAEQVYAPEKNWTYEGGIKAGLDGLTVNAALFHVDWSSLQVNRPQTGGTIGTPLILGNVSGAKVNGIEASAVWRPANGLSVSAGGALSKAKFDDDATDPTISRALCQNPAALPVGTPPCTYTDAIGGNRIPRSPSFQANLGLAYEAALTEALGWSARVDLSHQNRLYTDNTNSAWAPSRTLVDAALGVKGDWWSARAFVRNVFDRKYVSYAFATFAGSGAGSGVTYAPLLGDRRSGGVTLSFRY
jgi:iron complex outermembrane recepter protein